MCSFEAAHVYRQTAGDVIGVNPLFVSCFVLSRRGRPAALSVLVSEEQPRGLWKRVRPECRQSARRISGDTHHQSESAGLPCCYGRSRAWLFKEIGDKARFMGA